MRCAFASAVVVVVAVAAACPPGLPPEPPPVIEDDTGRWEALAPLALGARQETAVVAVGTDVYVIGGFSDAGVTAAVEVYDTVAGTWRNAADLPLPLHHANGVAVDGGILIAGFLTGGGFDEDGRVFFYDVDDDTWSERASMPAGTERGASAVAAVGDVVYVFGGLRGGSSALSSRYDVATDTWTALPPLPQALDHLLGFAIDDALYVVGGRQNGLGNHTAALLRYRDGDAGYTALSPMPTSRAGAAGAAVNGALVVVGGEGNPDLDSGVFAEAERYDVASDTWATLLEMRTPRHGMGAASVDGVLYVPGGATVQGFAGTAIHERFVAGD